MLSGGTLISNILLIPFLLKEIIFVRITKKDIIKHIKPIIILFIPVIAISLYKIMDKIMLGRMSEINEVGFYEQAEKIISVPMGFIAAMGTVMLPRISNLVAKGDNETIKRYMHYSLKFMMFLAFPLCFGIIAISETFIPLFLGDGFIKSSTLVNLLAITIIFLSFSNILITQYLVPREKDKIYIISVIGGAVTNLIINAILIPKFYSIGACIGTIAAEFFVMISQIIAVRKSLPIKEYFREMSIYFVKALTMFAIIMLLKLLPINKIVILFLQVIIGVIIYFTLNYKYIFSLLKKKV